MKCPKCGFSQQDGGAECVKCGVIFSRIKPKIARRAKGDGAASWTDQLEVDGASGIAPIPKVETMAGAGAESLGWEEKKEFARRFLLEELIDLPPWAHYARGALLAVMLWGTVKLTFTSNIPLLVNTMQFMHLINLVFHEAGHIIFTPFGRFIQVLGGSLLQTLIPLVCLGGFLLVWRDPFAASVAWWWTGENLVDLAPYIYDARAGDMMLLGGMTGRDNPDIHDWKNLLTWTGLLKYDHLLASLAYYTGLLMMFSALLWGGLVVYRGLTTKEDM